MLSNLKKQTQGQNLIRNIINRKCNNNNKKEGIKIKNNKINNAKIFCKMRKIKKRKNKIKRTEPIF